MEFFSPRFGWLMMLLLPGLLLTPAGGRRLLITLASCLFYAAWDWRYMFLLLLISGIDFVAAAAIAATSHPGRRKAWLLFSLVSNLGLLGYFKYANFFLETAGFQPLALVLPAGISFYTFKSLSYTLDVYRGQLEPCRSWWDYAFFVTFFPDLIAGPIVRASVFLPQIQRLPGLHPQRLWVGAQLFLQGLTKKLVFADRLAELAEPVFLHPQAFATSSLWLAMLAYAGQIFCDFSGYSDMAVGTAHALGYDLPVNFNMPYLSRSLSEFWRRWHITLSEWLRDYLYIPLGGNRLGLARQRFNLLLTMLLGGLWHGAGFPFLAWGALHGVALAVEHSLRGKVRLAGWLAWALTQSVVLVGWVIFRSPSLGLGAVFLSRLVGSGGLAGQHLEPEFFLVLMLLLVVGHGLGVWSGRLARLLGWLGLESRQLPLAGEYLCFVRANFFSGFLLTLWVFAILLYGSTQPNPFIYFQF